MKTVSLTRREFDEAFVGFVGLASACALVALSAISFACQTVRVGLGSDKGSEIRRKEGTVASRPQDGLSQPVNTARPTGGKPADLFAATAGVAVGSPGSRFERSASALLGEGSGPSAQGTGLDEGTVASQTLRPETGQHPGSTRGAVHERGNRGASLRVLATSAAHLCGVPVAIFHALIQRESSWRHWVVSSSGAVGLGQIKPSTLRDIDPRLNAWVPWDNLLGSACYLRQQFDRFGTWRKALHAYHAGPNRKTTRRATHDYASDIMGAN